jgi:hypothetical protein
VIAAALLSRASEVDQGTERPAAAVATSTPGPAARVDPVPPADAPTPVSLSPAAAALVPPGPAPSPAEGPASDPPEPPSPPPTPRPAPAKVTTGLLRLDTEPWTQVFFKGRKLGDTPLIDVRLPSGPHELLLINDEQRIRTVIDVEISTGRTTTKRLHF